MNPNRFEFVWHDIMESLANDDVVVVPNSQIITKDRIENISSLTDLLGKQLEVSDGHKRCHSCKP